MKGKFITLEGCEGAGKSKQMKLLEEELVKRGIDYVTTREPGGTFIAEKLRGIILDIENSEMSYECEALLYAAARVEHIKNFIKPNIDNGKLVVCDRYIDSSFAYQAYARGLGYGFVEKVNGYAMENCLPDLTILLDISPERAFLRKGGADKNDRLEAVGIEFHKKVYDGYNKLKTMFPERIAAIDCSGERMETHDKIMKVLEERAII